MRRTLLLTVFVSIGTLHASWDLQWHDVNRWRLPFTNYGMFGMYQGKAGAEWPQGSGHTYVYGAGLWIGCIKKNQDGSYDTLVTEGYNLDVEGSEMSPGYIGQKTGDMNAKIYVYPVDWPLPRDIFPMAPSENKSSQDAWMVYNDNNSVYHMPYDTRPIGIEVYQTNYAWTFSYLQDMVFMRFEVKNKSPDTLHKLILGICADNDIGNPLDEVNWVQRYSRYVSGNETLTGCFNHGYTEDIYYLPGWERVAYKLLHSPYALADNIDNDRWEDSVLYRSSYPGSIVDTQETSEAFFRANIPADKWDADGDGVADWQDESCIEKRGITSFKSFTSEDAPKEDWARYLAMAGYNYITRVYEPYDRRAMAGSDYNFVLSSGPATLAPESSAVLLISVMAAKHTRNDPKDLRMKSLFAQYIYDHNWLIPTASPSPSLVCVPGDHKVTLLWDNLSEMTPDPYARLVSDPNRSNYEPFYKKYDFAGYRVWRSYTGKGVNWQLIGSFDRADGDTFTYSDDFAVPESIKIIANDNGLGYVLTDTAVRNGFTYYYAVTAYDHNYLKSPDTLNPTPVPVIFESGRRVFATSPRTDAAGIRFSPPQFLQARMTSGNPRAQLAINAAFLNPYMSLPRYALAFDPLMNDSSDYRFLSVIDESTGTASYYAHPIYKWVLSNDSLADSMLTGFYLPRTKNPADYAYALDTVRLPIFKNDGVQLSFVFDHRLTPGDSTYFKEIRLVVNNGNYPATWPTLTTLEVAELPYTAWAFSGEEYEIRWKAHPQGGITCDILEVRTDRFLPYTPCSLSGQIEIIREEANRVAAQAHGWFFRGGKWPGINRFVPTDTLHREGLGRGTKYVYLAGLRFAMKQAGLSLAPGDPLPAPGDIWRVYVDDSLRIPPLQTYEIDIIPGWMETIRMSRLNVKVVPNPYLATNEWEKSQLERKLKFINLPPECTIRIFTTNGELIRTFKHNQRVRGSAQPSELGGDEWWDLRTEHNRVVSSGIYIFHVYSKDVGEQVGKFVIIR